MEVNDNLIKDIVSKYNKFLNKDIFISKRDYDNFLEELKINEYLNTLKDSKYYKYIELISNDSYKYLENHNNKFIDYELNRYQDYFDNMFMDIDKNIKLDYEQRKAIVADEDYSLIVAGAGSGKTTTMAAKTKYLIEKKGINPSKILLLSFTNKACMELDYRINEEFNLGVEVLTFHKLGMQFIRQIFDKPVKICSSGTMALILDKYIRTKVFPDKKKFETMTRLFKEYLTFPKDAIKYPTFEEFYEASCNLTYEKNKNNLQEYNNNAIKKRLKNNITIKGEQLKSKGEVEIANFLTFNNIKYEYEKTYPNFVSNKHSYIPDFTIYNGELEYFIEYYGLATQEDNGTISLSSINEYNRIIKKKRELHQYYKTDLIELYNDYEDYNVNYLTVLKEELTKRNIPFQKLTDEEIFRILYYSNQRRHYFKFSNLVSLFISNFKNKGYLDKDFIMLENKVNDNLLKEQLEFIREIYNYYDYSIHSKYIIDFNDMINYAYYGISKIKNTNKLKYDYIIVDEYQDISVIRYQLLKELANIYKSKIVAVGDDWQAIFAFSGSDINMFTNFYNLMGYADILRITNTYRNSQELIDISGKFILKNTKQLEKQLHSNKHLENPVELVSYENDKVIKLKQILDKLEEENKNYKILLLGRFKDDIDEVLNDFEFKRGIDDEIIYKNLHLVYLTVHSSKGLGFDQVILLNGIDGIKGFPAKIMDTPLIKILLPINNELIEYPEERRLFYVALTRTKNKVYILIPKQRLNRSEFVKEIENFDNVSKFN